MGLCGGIQSVSSKSFHARVPARHPLYVAPPELRDESRRAILHQLSVRPQKYREQFDGFVASDLKSSFQNEPTSN